MIRLFAIALFLQIPLVLSAQPEFEDDVDDVPLDGGISVLLAAGAAYGAKKIYQSKQFKTTNLKKITLKENSLESYSLFFCYILKSC